MKRGQYAPTRSYESVIPLILILILAVFIAGKFGWVNLNDVPLVGGLFPAPYIKVVVVGQASRALETVMSSEDYRIAGITYTLSMRQDHIVPGVLKSFDIIILQGSTVCDRTARREIADQVKAGKKLIVVGDACTRVSDDPNALGWNIGVHTMGDVMPVSYGGMSDWSHEATGQSTVYAPSGKFKIVAPDNPMFNGIKNFAFTGSLTKVVPTASSNVLAYVDTYLGKPTSPATYAIVESQGMLTGKTVYFAFDPGTTSRNMLMNTILYLKGAKG